VDHHEKHHQQHEKERHERIEHEKESEHRAEKLPRRIHPAWFVFVGTALVLVVVLSWILLFW
jgi:type VI protein secretion system component VasF